MIQGGDLILASFPSNVYVGGTMNCVLIGGGDLILRFLTVFSPSKIEGIMGGHGSVGLNYIIYVDIREVCKIPPDLKSFMNLL